MLEGCFDRGPGIYRPVAGTGMAAFQFDPRSVAREEPIFLVTGFDADQALLYPVDDSPLTDGTPFAGSPSPPTGSRPAPCRWYRSAVGSSSRR